MHAVSCTPPSRDNCAPRHNRMFDLHIILLGAGRNSIHDTNVAPHYTSYRENRPEKQGSLQSKCTRRPCAGMCAILPHPGFRYCTAHLTHLLVLVFSTAQDSTMNTSRTPAPPPPSCSP